MNREAPLDPAPKGITTLDLLLFTAGFACGWVMHQGSALRAGHFYILRVVVGGFHSLLGTAWAGWLWACVTGLAFLIVGRRFRYDCRSHVAEWLAVALAIVLIESVYPAFRMKQVASMTGETVWFEAPGATSSGGGTPAYKLWWPRERESWEERCWVALRLTAAAALVGMFAWYLRGKLSPGLVAVAGVVIAVLFALGPMRLAEGTSIEISSSAPIAGYQPSAGEKPWSWRALAAYYDTRAWAGYSLRALALITLAMLAAVSLVKRWRAWLWTEWAAAACAAVIAACWVYDEFVARPALDRTVRVVLLGTWLLAIAMIAGVGIFGWRAIGRRFWNANATGDHAGRASPSSGGGEDS
jgi:hypothetical protein